MQRRKSLAWADREVYVGEMGFWTRLSKELPCPVSNIMEALSSKRFDLHRGYRGDSGDLLVVEVKCPFPLLLSTEFRVSTSKKKKKNKMVVINITFFDHSLLDILCASMSRSRRKRVTDLALQGYIRSIYR